ncbi:hypothetical protein Enr13x_00750 [Stieleria neptunia]|uniref:Uncharacterized protein n=1 Tax=Stieleria neptunia TaxID=2527979 RepID=A0A518HHI5_9BACT|nr:hypothetical protein Enr13x_00750 [Stieleria neptunia]
MPGLGVDRETHCAGLPGLSKSVLSIPVADTTGKHCASPPGFIATPQRHRYSKGREISTAIPMEYIGTERRWHALSSWPDARTIRPHTQARSRRQSKIQCRSPCRGERWTFTNKQCVVIRRQSSNAPYVFGRLRTLHTSTRCSRINNLRRLNLATESRQTMQLNFATN